MRILVVSPHPDDETLGAGGTLLKYKHEGKKIYWLNITNMKEEYGYDKDIVKERNLQIEKVKNYYNFDGFYNLELCPAKLDKYEDGEVIGKISKIINDVKPEMILLPNYSDVHSDHKKIFDWCFSCTKVFRYPFLKRILTMEILSETDFANPQDGFIPNYFVDISNEIDGKLECLSIYKSEIGEHPFPRSIEGIKSIAIIRGIAAGSKYAEAFKLIKFIE